MKKPIVQKEKLQKALSLLKQAENFRDKAYKIGNKFTEANTPYKPGDKLIVERFGNKDWITIRLIKFNPDSNHPAKLYLNCAVWTKDWKRLADRRSNIHLDFEDYDYYKIIEHIPC